MRPWVFDPKRVVECGELFGVRDRVRHGVVVDLAWPDPNGLMNLVQLATLVDHGRVFRGPVPVSPVDTAAVSVEQPAEVVA